MRVLIDILHPAHVHFFKHAIRFWQERGDDVLVLGREKECANDLLRAYGIPFTSVSALGTRKLSLVRELLVRDYRVWRAARAFRPDVLVGINGIFIAQIGKLIRRPAIVFYDTENATLTNAIAYPLAHSVCTPVCYKGRVRGRHVTYPGYHELAYLHPNRFTLDADVVRSVGLNPGENYFILRFVSWQASHDVGEIGLGAGFKRKLVELLQNHGRVLISSEGELPEDLRPYRFTAPPEKMHDVIAFSTMLIGESATMASEAAVLGVPAFFISDTGRGYTDEEQDAFGLVFTFTTRQPDDVFARLNELLAMPDLRAEFQKRRARLLDEKIDTTAWLIDYVDRVAKET